MSPMAFIYLELSILLRSRCHFVIHFTKQFFAKPVYGGRSETTKCHFQAQKISSSRKWLGEHESSQAMPEHIEYLLVYLLSAVPINV